MIAICSSSRWSLPWNIASSCTSHNCFGSSSMPFSSATAPPADLHCMKDSFCPQIARMPCWLWQPLTLHCHRHCLFCARCIWRPSWHCRLSRDWFSSRTVQFVACLQALNSASNAEGVKFPWIDWRPCHWPRLLFWNRPCHLEFPQSMHPTCRWLTWSHFLVGSSFPDSPNALSAIVGLWHRLRCGVLMCGTRVTPTSEL